MHTKVKLYSIIVCKVIIFYLRIAEKKIESMRGIEIQWSFFYCAATVVLLRIL